MSAEVIDWRNPRIVAAAKLHRAAARRKSGTFLAEGANSVAAALDTGRVTELFYSPRAATREHELVATAAALGVRTTAVSERAAEHLGETVTPPGLVAMCRLVDVPLAQVVSRAADSGTSGCSRLLAVPVQMSDPGNAGTLIRVADAVGADGVVLAGDSVDPHNGKCVRACAGSLFHVPIARDRDIDAVLTALRDNGITVLATTARGEVDLDEADELLRDAGESGGTAWLFGNEAHGLDPAVAARADHRVRIPIHGRAESLNLAAAAAICLYADARVRHRS
ncbi:putative ribosomal RNA methyltransferase [Nocardia nova SH22a]|uniref:Putative ribosomal RNA methyltransferase n=1 Tax=Nocardia nova SH22a TaxID=1415166 RepID=W5TDQ8_9NOCA|nr:RNA methyltransferase [Nocardia nova]AHH17309.1 putative ribosomal RNA methyltransferase [Nocardia nova SH22a]